MPHIETLLKFAWVVLFCAVATQPAIGQDEEEEGFAPGLLARYSQGDRSVEWIDPDIGFVWGAASPDERISADSFDAEWAGNLLVRQEGRYRFHAYVQGKVEIELDGQRILDGASTDPKWISGTELDLTFGEKVLVVRYHKSGPTAELRLFWSSDKFRVEPVPHFLLFHEEPRPDLRAIQRGRIAFDDLRCNRCHARDNELASFSAPALNLIRGAIDRDSLIAQLRGTENSPHSRMPQFGFKQVEAESIAAFLLAQSAEAKLQTMPASKDGDSRTGQLLLRSIGCLACHRVGEEGNDRPYAGGDLSDIGRKRSANWLHAWLRDPAQLNVDHRMPIFRLNEDEQRQLAAYLSGLRMEKITRGGFKAGEGEAPAEPRMRIDSRLRLSGSFALPIHITEIGYETGSTHVAEKPADADSQQIAHGRKLVNEARCSACHRIPGVELPKPKLSDLSKPVTDWNTSCLAAEPDRRNWRPTYQQLDIEPLKSFIQSRTGEIHTASAAAQGAHLLARRNCIACHERGASKGLAESAAKISQLDPRLKGESEALVPPSLEAVGDKLQDEWLVDATAGKHDKPRLPWLRVRMPRFEHSADEQAHLLAHLISHDRIPDGGPNTPLPTVPETDRQQKLLTGQTLVGAKGFSCTACHKVGKYEPRNTALGTRGSDLVKLGQRMRPEYYLRWTRAPLRIIPGMEMPSYERPVPQLLEQKVDLQLSAMWDALNDSDFTPPVDPTSVEQYLVIEPGAPARIVRDVFTTPKENGGRPTARAIAIGLNNGHNVLYDLDTLTVRQWTVGDFARQRTEGKSWYWDLAGVPVVRKLPTDSDIALLSDDPSRSSLIEPSVDRGRSGRLVRYQPFEEGVRFDYELNFVLDGRDVVLPLTETITPVAADGVNGQSGWRRQIEFTNVPTGYRVLVGRDHLSQDDGAPTIELSRAHDAKWQSFAANDSQEFIAATNDGVRTASVALDYTCKLDVPSLPLKAKPSVVATSDAITSVPGFDGTRLPIDGSIMPTAMTFLPDGRLAFTSLKGHVYIADDSDGDGLQDRLTLFEEGLAAPYGIIADGDDIIVSHKPELLRLRDTNGDGRADERIVIADGWGYSDNYHDWTCGIVRDSNGNLYVGLGSDYAQGKRQQETALWRGKVLRIDSSGKVTPIAHAFRYPTGFAIDEFDRLFVSDNQGVQNTFNEINHIVDGGHYGVPSRYEEQPDAPSLPPAMQVPHPWTRSVNGLFFLKAQGLQPLGLMGHGIGCEYDSRFLVRFTTQQVGETMQGAIYPFSRPEAGATADNFLGPLCGCEAPNGDIYIGSIFDSGWLGGQNTGEIVRLRASQTRPNGIREIRALPDGSGFEISFFNKVDASAAADLAKYSISGYTRVWGGAYATPDSDRHKVEIKSAKLAADGRSVTLNVDRLQAGYVYEITCGNLDASNKPLWPATGHYTMNVVPSAAGSK